jgi:hypothetical protein
MSTSFIDYNEKGIWMPDRYVELLARYILQVLDNYDDKVQLTAFKERCSQIADGAYPGWNNFGFDTILIGKELVILEILSKTKSFLLSKGQAIYKDDLNSYLMPQDRRGLWQEDVETSKLISYIIQIERLVANG